MASNVDVTFPADNVKVDKALMRANFNIISEEITALQRINSYAWQIATNVISL